MLDKFSSHSLNVLQQRFNNRKGSYLNSIPVDVEKSINYDETTKINEVKNVLRQIIDPEDGCDLIEAELVNKVEIVDNSGVTIELKLSSRSKSVADEIKKLCMLQISMLDWVTNVSVTKLVMENPIPQFQDESDSMKEDQISRIVAVSSCKGGVGKSTISVNLAYTLSKLGYKVGILDADIYGPSLPTMTKPVINGKLYENKRLIPVSYEGVKLMSLGFMNNGAAIMRGPMVNQILNQFVTLCDWGELDYLIIDMPPGTGDIQITLAQIMNITAAVIVTTPQRLSFVDVVKGIDLFDTVNVPCLAVVENMAEYSTYSFSPDFYSNLTSSIKQIVEESTSEVDFRSIEEILRTGIDSQRQPIKMFGSGHLNRLRDMWGIPAENLISIPLVETVSEAGDSGQPFVLSYPNSEVAAKMEYLAKGLIKEMNRIEESKYIPESLIYDSLTNHMLYQENMIIESELSTVPEKKKIISPYDLRCACKCAVCVEEFSGKPLLDKKKISKLIKPLALAPIVNRFTFEKWALHNMTDSKEDTNVRVAVRCRPFNEKERNNGEVSCVKIQNDKIALINPTTHEEHSFGFDIIIDETFSQETIWNNIGIPILEKAFSGYNGTIFAYGQTGSGKTWSMQGGGGDSRGIIPRMNYQLFDKIAEEKLSRQGVLFLVTVSYFEIYNEVIFDLLDATDRKKKSGGNSKGGLEIKEHPVLGVYVKGLQEIVVDSAPKLQFIIDQGMGNRTVASTQMNADSSRSHSVFVITVHQKDVEDESKNVFAKVNLVDLAGSERVKSTGATGSTLKEGANINKSLSALGNVINALVESSKGKANFIPYRNSKLTRVLQESLGGNSITVMLAALSPAACNFEETLSTLKYANRAKDIKIKAVKNEEASQISKLNDEIRLLREKLMGQNENPTHIEVDTSALEDKHRLQLKELEEAMKSTWEAKAKASEEHERERQKLLIEQKNAARQLESAKERNWHLLEQKDDVDLTLNHVKEVYRTMKEKEKEKVLSGTAPQQTAVVLDYAQSWNIILQKISKLQQTLTAQDALVKVYQTSLQKDSNALLKQATSTLSNSQHHFASKSDRKREKEVNKTKNQLITSFDSTFLSMLKQFREKFTAIESEIEKWTTAQDELQQQYSALLQQMKSDIQNLSLHQLQHEKSQDGGVSEVFRGCQLLLKQVTNKSIATSQSVEETRRGMIDYSVMGSDLIQILRIYEDSLTIIHRDFNEFNTEAASPSGMPASPKANTLSENFYLLSNYSDPKLSECLQKITKNIEYLQKELESFQVSRGKDILQSDSKSSVGPEVDKSSKKQQDIVRDITIDSSFDQIVKQSSSSNDLVSVPTQQHSLLEINQDAAWFANIQDKKRTDRSSFILSASWAQPKEIASISLQGAVVPRIKVNSSDGFQPEMATKVGINLENDVIPGSNITLNKCDGSIDVTAVALSEVMTWESLLKKNPPEKFLKRPPVRFLFDLIKHLATNYPGFFPTMLENSNWDEVGADKQNKVDFMQEIINFITSLFGQRSPITTAAAIVTGSDPNLTNVLLQQLAIAVYVYKTHILPTSTTQTKESEIAAWPTKVQIQLSMDGVNWSFDRVFSTELTNHKEVKTIVIQEANLNFYEYTKYQFLRILVTEWNGGDLFGPALRFQMKEFTASHLNSSESFNDSIGGKPTSNEIQSNQLMEGLSALHQSLDVLVDSVECLARRDEKLKERKQDEVKKNLEKLSKEKQALEQLLESEKQSLTNDKQDLSEQVKKLYNQLRETKSLFEREQELNNQLAMDRNQLEEEKIAVGDALKESQDENAMLKTEIMKLRANSEKDQNLMEMMQKKLASAEKLIELMREEVMTLTESRTGWEHEKDDLQSQVTVLIEERDTARAHEEELFEQLNERTNDLERLQESYVDMADRCNDAQDEVCELRDKIESLQELLTNRNLSNHKQDQIKAPMNPVIVPPPVVMDRNDPTLIRKDPKAINGATDRKSVPTAIKDNSFKEETVESCYDEEFESFE